MEHPRFSPDALAGWLAGLFAREGMTGADAGLAAASIVQADLYGFSTHGVIKIANHLERLRKGTAKPRPEIRTLRESPVSALLDADFALGFVCAPRAMDLALAKARAAGVGVVAVRRATTFGSCGVYTPRARPDCLGFAAINGGRGGVAPAGGREGLFSTDPFSICVPASAGDGLLLDMSTSVVAMTRVMQRQESGAALEPGWALDAAGAPTADPAKVHVLLPLGGLPATGGAKGTGLALAVEALAGVLAGAAGAVFARGERPELGMCGHFFAALRLDLFREPEEFRAEMSRLLDLPEGVAPLPGGGPVRAPGRRAFAEERRRRAAGIPLSAAETRFLEEVGRREGQPFPEPLGPG